MCGAGDGRACTNPSGAGLTQVALAAPTSRPTAGAGGALGGGLGGTGSVGRQCGSSQSAGGAAAGHLVGRHGDLLTGRCVLSPASELPTARLRSMKRRSCEWGNECTKTLD